MSNVAKTFLLTDCERFFKQLKLSQPNVESLRKAEHWCKQNKTDFYLH